MKNNALVSIVDDDFIYKYAIKIQFKEVGFMSEIMDFDHGEEALEFMVNNLSNPTNLPDYIFLDINMPIMDGFEFMEEFIKLKPNIGKPIVVYMVSSSVNTIDVHRANEISEISDYIVKPLAASRLRSLIQNL